MASFLRKTGAKKIDTAIKFADERMDPSYSHVMSERAGGESRRAILKRNASGISRSACEFVALATSHTVSHDEAAVLMEAFGNVIYDALIVL